MIKENEKRGIHPNAHTTINQADLILKASLAGYYYPTPDAASP